MMCDVGNAWLYDEIKLSVMGLCEGLLSCLGKVIEFYKQKCENISEKQ